MKFITWNKQKNKWLKQNRGICFEDILFYIDNDFLIDDVEHPNQKKYADQRMMVFYINEYIYLVPYVEDEDEIFLKTIIPSRKATKNYLEKNRE
jgi:uncharacterized DUF497 family protein